LRDNELIGGGGYLTEIFFSLQGESTLSGLPTIFVRLTGCPLRCGYCDTAYAFKGGNKHSFEDILTILKTYPCQRVCVTGGEPLAQKACFPFLSFLADAGYTLSLETSGAIDIQDVDPRTMIVMDLKTPDSLEESKNIYDNISYLKPKDQKAMQRSMKRAIIPTAMPSSTSEPVDRSMP
jgi:7-carboxy-7-deazaguanine synthase